MKNYVGWSTFMLGPLLLLWLSFYSTSVTAQTPRCDEDQGMKLLETFGEYSMGTTDQKMEAVAVGKKLLGEFSSCRFFPLVEEDIKIGLAKLTKATAAGYTRSEAMSALNENVHESDEMYERLHAVITRLAVLAKER